MSPIKKNHRFIWMVIVFTVMVNIGLSGHSQGHPAAIEPKADQLLQQMSDYLASLKQFGVKTENTLEVVYMLGEKIQHISPTEVYVRRPNKLRADRKGDIVDQEFYFDGKTLTLFQKDDNCYATVEAPQSIDEMIDFARESLDVYTAGGDLIYSNAYNVLMEDVVSGSYVGRSVVDGIACHHLFFRGNEVDWQIWIADDDKPLPKKFIITSKWIAGAPQFTVYVKDWNLSPQFSEDIFTFVPPKDARKIDFIRQDNDAISRR